MGRSRDIAEMLSKTETNNTNNNALAIVGTPLGLDSAEVASVGLQVFQTLDSLPTSNLVSGQQALVDSDKRLYISNGLGWYNIAVINQTPSLTITPSGSIALANDGTPTTITLTASDSDTPSGLISFSVESDGSFSGLGTLSQDSSVFTITPKLEDSATTTTSTLTFKASDGINFGTGQSALSLTFSAATADSSDQTVFLLNAFGSGSNQTLTDKGTNSLTVTNKGTVENTTHSPYRSGSQFTGTATSPGGYYSTFFDQSRHFTISASSDFDFSNGDFTIEWWNYWLATPSAYETLYDNGYGTYPNITIQLHGGYEGRWIVYTNGTSNTMEETAGVPLYEWIHYAVVRNGNTLTLYRNGVANVSMSVAGLNCGQSSAITGLGARASNGSAPLQNVHVSDFRIVKGTAIYTTTFTPPTEPLPNVSGRKFHMLSLPNHEELEGNNVVQNDADNPPEIVGFSPYNRQVYDKDVHGTALHFPDRSDGFAQVTMADVGTGDVTIECWVYFLDMASNHTIFTANHGSSTDLFDLYWQSASAEFRLYSNSATVGTLASGYYPPIEEWIHVCLYRSGTTVTFYINGEQKGQITDANYNANLNGTFNIGSYSNSGSETLSGNMTDFCVTTGQKYSTVPFAPPTTPIASGNSNQKLLLTGHGITMGDHSQFTQQLLSKQYGPGDGVFGNTGTKKFASSPASVYINGSQGGLVIENDPVNGTANEGMIYFGQYIDFTIETWIYLPAGDPGYGGYSTVFHCGSGLVADASFTQWQVTQGTMTYYRSSTQVMGGGTLTADTWHHIALTKNGSNMNMWLDGNSAASINTGNTNHPQASPGSIGIGCRRHGSASGTYIMKGFLEDFRITLHKCRYTGTFTPPGKLLG